MKKYVTDEVILIAPEVYVRQQAWVDKESGMSGWSTTTCEAPKKAKPKNGTTPKPVTVNWMSRNLAG